MRVVALSDTHVRDGSATTLPVAVWRALEQADVILHAGDVTGPGLLAQLTAARAGARRARQQRS
jgi:predicted phosphodiesterase